MTIEDIAKMANVSTMTVSRALNEPHKVKESTRRRIDEIIRRVNFHPNLLAKSLVNGKSKTIGVLYSNIRNQIYLDIIRGIDNVAYKSDYIIMTANLENYDISVRTLEKFISNQVEGLIVLPMDMAMAFGDDYEKSKREMADFYRYLEDLLSRIGLPAVTVHQRIESAYNIALDFPELAATALEYLFARGYRRISMVNSRTRDGLWAEKEEVYRRMMEERGFREHIDVAYGFFDVEGGFAAMRELLGREQRCEAVFCANDLMAVGAINAINRAGLRIPEEISVIGNDNNKVCEMSFPKLTSVSLNSYLIGQNALKLLFDLIDGKSPEERVAHFGNRIVERESVGIR